MLRGLVTGVLALLLLWAGGGYWFITGTEQQLTASARELMNGSSAQFDDVKVSFQGQTAILEGTVASPEVAAAAQDLVAAKVRVRGALGHRLNPVAAVKNLLQLPAAQEKIDPTVPKGGATPDVATKAEPWVLVCASGDRVRLAGAVADIAASAALSGAVRRRWPAAKVTNMLKVDDGFMTFPHLGNLAATMPKASEGDDLIAAARHEGVWMNLPATADELTVAQALSGASPSLMDISSAMLGWRQIRKPPAPPPAPAPPPIPSPAPEPEVLPVAKPLGPPYVGWAISQDEVDLFGAVCSETQKVELLHSAEKWYSPRVINVGALNVDASRVENGKVLSLPNKLGAKPIGLVVAGQPVSEYGADVLDSEISNPHRSLGLTTQEIGSALQPFREKLIGAGKLKAFEPYICVTTNGMILSVAGQVASSAAETSIREAAAAIAGSMKVEFHVTVSRTIREVPGLASEIRKLGSLPPGKVEIFSIQGERAAKRGVVHSIHFAASGNRSVDKDRAIEQIQRVLRIFPNAHFEVVGQPDGPGKELVNSVVAYLTGSGKLNAAIIQARAGAPDGSIQQSRSIEIMIQNYE